MIGSSSIWYWCVRLNVAPGGSLFQTTQGVSAPAPKGVVQRESGSATALRAAEVTNGPQRAQAAEMVPATSPSEKPRPNMPRGSLLDIKA